MKAYTSIPKWSPKDFGKYCFGFDKIDGSNFRAEWDRKLSKKSRFTNGFKKFGTRTELVHTHSPFAEAIGIFENKYSEAMDKVFNEDKAFKGVDKITVYGEFFGASSFAGQHDWKEPHDVKLFDVFLYKKSYLDPAEFVKVFKHLDIPELLFTGAFDENTVASVVNDKKLKEGMVFKHADNRNVEMFKVKTQDWLDKVKNLYGETKMLEY
jgi:hypothetical protein